MKSWDQRQNHAHFVHRNTTVRGLESSESVWPKFERTRGSYLKYLIVWHLSSPVLAEEYDRTRATREIMQRAGTAVGRVVFGP